MKIPEGMKQEKNSTTPEKSIVSTTVIILLTLTLLAIFAGLGYWYHLVMNTPITDNTDPVAEEVDTNSTKTTDPSAEAMAEVNTSDELEAIEADIDNTELDNLDQELNAIDAELEAAMEAQ